MIKVKGDTLFEPDETFSVVHHRPGSTRAPGPDKRGEITIDDDDSTPTPTLSNASVLEGNSGLVDLVFEATLAAPHSAVTFNYRTVADTANTTDYDAASGSKLFPANATTTATKVPITVKVKGDLLDEVDETLKLELLNNNDVVVRTAIGTIRNDDSNSKMSISDASAEEPGTMTFTVTLSAASAREVKVNWGTADGTATAGSDYTAGGGELTFAPGETSKTIAVEVLGDDTNEENETLKVNLSNPSGIPANRARRPGRRHDRRQERAAVAVDQRRDRARGCRRDVHGHARGHDPADGHGQLQHDRGDCEGRHRLLGAHRHALVRAGRELEVDHHHRARRHCIRADRGLLRRDRRRGQRDDHEEPRSRRDRGERPGAAAADGDPKPPDAQAPVSVLVPRMILGPRTVTIGPNGVARMLVTCQRISPIGCAGTVELERSTKPLLKLGKKTFTVKKGGKGYASIKLSARTLAILRKSKTGTLRAKVIVIVKTNTKKTMRVSPGVITLKGTKAFLLAKPKPAAPPTQVVVDP